VDYRHFENLTRSLTTLTATPSRRAVARLLAAFSLAGALGTRIRLEDAAAKKKPRKNKKKKKKPGSSPSASPPASPSVVCKPNCDGRSCGADGCGGSCGSCDHGGSCQDGTCHWEPVHAETEREEVASERYMQTKATLNVNGLLTVESTTWNEVFAGFALRGRVLVVVEDAHNRAIWVSEEFACTTRCPFVELCDKSGKEVFQQQFPDHPQLGPIVGKYAAKLAIYQSNGTSDLTFRDRWVGAIKDATDIAGPLIELARLFL
jgi:hypothetical protein